MKKFLLAVLVAVIGTLAGAIFIKGMVKGFQEARQEAGKDKAERTASIEQRLADSAKEVNAKLPRMEADGARLDSVAAGPGARLAYTYTLVNISSAKLDLVKFTELARPRLIEVYKTSTAMAPFRKMEVEMSFRYLDKDGKPIGTVVASPKDL